MKHLVARTEDFGPGDVRTVRGAKQPVVVVCTNKGEYHAVRALCPHQGAELAAGQLTNLTISDDPGKYFIDPDSTVLRCPWHSFDFAVDSGQCASDGQMRVRTFPVSVEDGDVVVEI